MCSGVLGEGAEMADVHRVWIDRIRTEREARGWDKPEMARRLALAAGEARGSLPSHDSLLSYVKRWERGDVEEISDRYQLLYVRALGTAREDLFEEGEAAVNRRGFVGSSLVATFTLALPPATEMSSGRRIDACTVARLRNRTARLRRLDDVLGGADTYPIYRDELKATTVLTDEASYTDVIGRALMGVIAEQAQQAGWAAFDSGRQAAAHRHFKDSLTAASDAGDTSLLANALAFLAYQKVSIGQPGTGEADASCRVTAGRETPPTVRALLYERAAWAHAVAGDVAAVDEALHHAQEALADKRAGSHGPDWAVWVDQTELEIMSGRCWSTLGDHARAVPTLTRALDRYDDTHARDKALYLTWLAGAHIDADDIEQAAAVTSRAVALCADVASVRPQARISETLRRLQQHRAVPAVTDLIEEAEMLIGRSPGAPSPGRPASRREA